MGTPVRRTRKHVNPPHPSLFVLLFIPAIPSHSPSSSIAFGHILTRLTAAKEEGAFVTIPDGSKVALGIPQAQKAAGAHLDIPLRRPGTATEAASVILAVASPLMSYVDGQTIMVTGGRNM